VMWILTNLHHGAAWRKDAMAPSIANVQFCES